MSNKNNHAKAAIICLIITTFLSINIFLSGQVYASGGEEKYEQVDPMELSFSIKDFSHRSVIDEDGGKPIGGNIGELTCSGKKIELISHEFEDGYILTKKYGKIKIRFSTSLTGEGFSLWITPSQKQALKELTLPKNQVKGAADQFNYNPIKKETERRTVPKQFNSIQKAVNSAKDGATIVISPGVYEETVIISKKSVLLTSEHPENDDVVASTVIDAKQKGNALFIEDSSSVIVGLTFQGGYTESKGGGIRVTGKSSPLIKGNIIKDNTTSSLGGGILILEAGEPRILRNTVSNNKANGGAGIYAISSSVYMKKNNVFDNVATKGGGGVWLQECNGILLDNSFADNEAEAGGGLYISKNSEVDIVKNEIRGNSSAVGGGMFVIAHNNLQIRENAFSNNKARKAAGGIAIAVKSVCTLDGNSFENNEAPQAGVGLVQDATVTANKNTFKGNKPENELLN